MKMMNKAEKAEISKLRNFFYGWKMSEKAEKSWKMLKKAEISKLRNFYGWKMSEKAEVFKAENGWISAFILGPPSYNRSVNVK